MKKLLFALTVLCIVATSFAQSAKSQEPSIPGMALIKGNEPTTNHPILEQYVKEWISSAKTFNEPNQIDYLEPLSRIRSVQYQDLPLSDYWAVTKSGDIYINIRFIEYKHLTRVMVYQSIGYVLGVPLEKRGRLFMSTTWTRSEKEDGYAKHNAQGFSQERVYFGKLAKKYPIKFYHKL